MKWEGRRQSSNVDDRRGISAKGGLIAGGGIVGIIVVLLQLFGGETGQQVASLVNQVSGGNQTQQAVERVELTAEQKKIGVFAQNGLGAYKKPTLVLFTANVNTGCGTASSAVGPFYCPADQKLYMDMDFFEELKTRFGAKGGDFAIAYVMAHEVGHHIQTLLGTSQQVRQKQQGLSKAAANKWSVAQELQADFYAGVWAHHNQKYLDADDIDEALSAANAVGDDAIQKRMQGHVVPDSFTHGTSEQRKYWFTKGYNTGDIRQGNIQTIYEQTSNR